MSIAIDTNVLVRILVQDPTAPAQCAAARRVVADATQMGENLLVSLCALLETGWVLRSRYKVGRQAITATFMAMLETPGIELEHDATVEEALYLFNQFASADFADCLLAARATHLGRSGFLTFDAGAARLPRADLLQQASSV
jgi:predicted nucleic-acid-binding protein